MGRIESGCAVVPRLQGYTKVKGGLEMAPVPEVILGKIAEPAVKWGLDQLIASLKSRLENKPNVDLDGVKRISGYLASFKSRGESGGATYQLPSPRPEIWSQEQTTFERIFADWSYDVGPNPMDSNVSAELKRWLKSLGTAETIIWKGTSGHFVFDFPIKNAPIKEAARHHTIRQMYPFVILCRIPKRGRDADYDYMYEFVLLFMKGWKVFLDDHTSFVSGNSLILNRMSYVEGDFYFKDVFYLDKDRNSDFSNQPLALRRHMIVSETNSSVHICLTGVPYIQHKRPESVYHKHVTRWYREFQIL
jgi:hypothetical protein